MNSFNGIDKSSEDIAKTILDNLQKLIDDGLKKKFNITGRPSGYTIYCRTYIANLLRDDVGDMKVVSSDHHSLNDKILIQKNNEIVDGFNNPINLGPLTFGK